MTVPGSPGIYIDGLPFVQTPIIGILKASSFYSRTYNLVGPELYGMVIVTILVDTQTLLVQNTKSI